MNYDLLCPVIDGITLPEYPMTAIAGGSAVNVPVIVGTSLHDHFNPGTVEDYGWLDDQALRRILRPYLAAHTDEIVDRYHQARPGASPSALLATILADRDWRFPAIKTAEAKLSAGDRPVFMYFYAPDSRSPCHS